MAPLTPLYIGYENEVGLELDKKPFMLPDAAFVSLENSFVWRERVRKRSGNALLGRLQRVLTVQSLGNLNSVAGIWSFNIFTVLAAQSSGTITGVTPGVNTSVLSVNHRLMTGAQVQISGVSGVNDINGNVFTITRTDANNFTLNAATTGVYGGGGTWITQANSIGSPETPEIDCGSVTIVTGAPTVIRTYTDNGTGQLIADDLPDTNFGTINYITGDVVITTISVNLTVSINLTYFPNLPVMGIWQQEVPSYNNETTIFFDRKYAYIFESDAFREFIPFTTWDADDFNFFWSTNYRGSEESIRLFFTTNFINNASNPIRYVDNANITWVDFEPQIDSANFLFQARILIPYYGRLLALNTYEGPTRGGSVNIFNRCRFSQIGNPVDQVNSWRQDIFGKGGFIDAPVSQDIIGAEFFKNTLIVFFERSTWQLRYVGEYGIPFIWERISSDFGSESTFSGILFDEGVLAVGSRAIITSSGVNCRRIDQNIPDQVFSFRNANHGVERVHSERDFQQELAYWCFSDTNNQEEGQYFPNKVLVLNYRNNTYAIFRDNVTCLGTYQTQNADAILWGNTEILWGNDDVYWNDPDGQTEFPNVVSGNQQGYIHYYNNRTMLSDPNMPIKSITSVGGVLQLEITNHNLVDGEFIYLTGLNFVDSATGLTPVATDLNDTIFKVGFFSVDIVILYKWDTTQDPHQYASNFSYTPDLTTSTYVGCGQAALLPEMQIQSKDFNPYIKKGTQLKMSYIDFLTDVESNGVVSISVFVNTSLASKANILTGNQQVNTDQAQPYYIPTADYSWHRFYQTCSGQFVRIQIGYDDDLLNDISTHRANYILNAMTLWVRPGGKSIF